MKSLSFLSLTLLSLLLLTGTGWAQGQAVLRNGDVFELRLSGMPAEFQQEYMQAYTISEEGMVEIPYVGSMRAAGSTVTQFSRTLEKKLVAEKIFTNPTVFINLQPTSRFVTIGGAVRSPGVVPWSSDMTLSVALKRAGGLGDFGSQTKIKVTREGKSQVFNLKRADKDPTQNPRLLPGDEIDVPE